MILPFAFSKTSFNVSPTILSDGTKPGPLRVGGVTEVREHPFPAKLRETGQVHRLAFDRSQVYLVVAGEDDQAGVGADRDGYRAGDGVVDVDELQPETTQVLGVSGLYLSKVALFDAELLQLGCARARA